MKKIYDVAVVGAGVFGAWTAYSLRRLGYSVLLLDAYGPGHTRSSSGDESRLIRIGYGPDELYSRWALRSMKLWKQFFRTTSETLFHRTGILWLAKREDHYIRESHRILRQLRVPVEQLSRKQIQRRFPQFSLADVNLGLFEPESGVLVARRAVQAVVREAQRDGVRFLSGLVLPPEGRGKLDSLETAAGEKVAARGFVFACGSWLPQVFPQLLGRRIFPTRQVVFYFAPPAGAPMFSPPAMPAWLHHEDEVYGVPDLESRGVKFASDKHGHTFDPETGARTVAPSELRDMQRYVRRRFPSLKEATLTETRVCQYENTSNGDFLIDRYPAFANVWLVGGGSGHGFKHGPAVGEYVARLLARGGPVEPRFFLASKGTQKKRSVH
jgi:monomeric sarcosine oxidase